MPYNRLILCCPLLLLPSIFPSITVLSNQSALCIRWPKNWSFSFSFSISPSNEYSGLISFRIDWFDLAVQRTLKRLLQHHSLKASIHWCLAFFMAQLSHPYMTTGKTIVVIVLVTQLCPTLCDPTDCSSPGSSVYGILQARILEWVAISFSRGSSWPGDWTQVSCIAGWFFTNPPQFNTWILIQADSGLRWSPLWAWFGAIVLALSTVLYSWMLLHLVFFPNGL